MDEFQNTYILKYFLIFSEVSVISRDKPLALESHIFFQISRMLTQHGTIALE